MNTKLLLICTLLALSTSAFGAKKQVIETIFSCTQNEGGDHPITAAIAMNDGPGLLLYLIETDYDTGRSNFIQANQVFSSELTKNRINYSDLQKDQSLVIEKKGNYWRGTYRGALARPTGDFPGGTTEPLTIGDLDCFENEKITIDL